MDHLVRLELRRSVGVVLVGCRYGALNKAPTSGRGDWPWRIHRLCILTNGQGFDSRHHSLSPGLIRSHSTP